MSLDVESSLCITNTGCSKMSETVVRVPSLLTSSGCDEVVPVQEECCDISVVYITGDDNNRTATSNIENSSSISGRRCGVTADKELNHHHRTPTVRQSHPKATESDAATISIAELPGRIAKDAKCTPESNNSEKEEEVLCELSSPSNEWPSSEAAFPGRRRSSCVAFSQNTPGSSPSSSDQQVAAGGQWQASYTPPPTGSHTILQTCRACGGPLFDSVQGPPSKEWLMQRQRQQSITTTLTSISSPSPHAPGPTQDAGSDTVAMEADCRSAAGGGSDQHSNESEWHGVYGSPLDSEEDRLLCTGCGRSGKLCQSERSMLSESLWSIPALDRSSSFRCSRLKHLYECFFFQHRRRSLVFVVLMLLAYHVILVALEAISLHHWRHWLLFHVITVFALYIPLLLYLWKLPTADPARTENQVTFPMDSLCLACTHSNSPPYQKLSTRREDLDTSGKTFWRIRIIGLLCLILIMMEAFIYLAMWSPPRQVISGAWFVLLASCCIHTMLPFALTLSIPVVAMFDISYMVVGSLSIQAANADQEYQMSAVALLLIASNLIGITHRAQTNKHQRDEFLTSLSCLKSTREVQGYISLQEKLLNSVVPQSITKEWKRTIDHNGALELKPMDIAEQSDTAAKCSANATVNFHDVILSMHDTVTILFADIVGFTKLSASIPAQQLVTLLNTIFSRFDDLAISGNCYRVKTLGDCYVCVSGLPDAHLRHADNCVLLGLKMLEETHRLSEETGLDLAVRIGVNTGSVVAGVLGKIKWHYDIYCDSVSVAAQLEASGEPGRVHISQSTFDLLQDTFSVEAVSPEKTGLGDVSYLIGCREVPAKPDSGFDDCVCKPSGADLETSNSDLSLPKDWDIHMPFSGLAISQSYPGERVLPQVPHDSLHNDVSTSDQLSDTAAISVHRPSEVSVDEHFEPDHPGGVLSVNGEPVMSVCDTMASVLSSQQLEQVRASDMNSWTLCFLPTGLERMYLCEEDKQFGVRTFYSAVVILLAAVAHGLINRHTWNHAWLLCAYFIPTVIYLLLFVARSCKVQLFSCHHYFVLFVQRNIWVRYITTTLTALVLPLLILLSVKDCDSSAPFLPGNVTSHASVGCDYPESSYLCLLIATKLLLLQTAILSYYVWLLALLIATTAVTLMFCVFHSVFDRKHAYLQLLSDTNYGDSEFTGYNAIGLVSVILAYVSNILHGRMCAEIRRFCYLCSWRISNKQHATDALQMHNRHLLLNIMPRHVADYFIAVPSHSPRLYSKEHKNAAVLFASIPNFGEYLRTVQSCEKSCLESVRMLNEIMCEFDSLLSCTRSDGTAYYRDVEKIKTVSSTYTYIVAAGLSGSEDIADETDMTGSAEDSTNEMTMASQRRAHTSASADLVRLARAMQHKLEEINESAFYSFKLRCGVHQGPLISGVLGAKKPLFDIFGDTVNIASRMESTGESGKIQVVQHVADELSECGFSFESRGLLQIKGIGEMATAFISDDQE
ncbi:adenylate cyclase type 6-like [Sycon ciliatum]|uniref:adenylate cyclase type 6-like n=1 Tax=Sycon ciliatum TaxID=27933 RepID=UPI0031F6D453